MTAAILRYGTALGRWIAAGRPVRSDERVREIFARFCRPCEHFDPDRQVCRVCGCHLGITAAAFANKIKMATERCPLHPPKWSEEIP